MPWPYHRALPPDPILERPRDPNAIHSWLGSKSVRLNYACMATGLQYYLGPFMYIAYQDDEPIHVRLLFRSLGLTLFRFKSLKMISKCNRVVSL